MAKPRKQYRPSGDVLMNPFALEDLIEDVRSNLEHTKAFINQLKSLRKQIIALNIDHDAAVRHWPGGEAPTSRELAS